MDHLTHAINILQSGGVIVFPTDTVWGIGALASNSAGVEKLYSVKGREFTKPSQILVSNISVAKQYGEFKATASELAEKHWPGALTIVVPAYKDKVASIIRGGGETVGLRAPDHSQFQELLTELNDGIVASSANPAGCEAPRSREAIDENWLKQIDYVLEGEAGNQPSSTVVKVEGDALEVLRQGEVFLN